MANSTIMTFSVHSTNSGVAKGGCGKGGATDVNLNGYCSQTGSCVAKKCAARSINSFTSLLLLLLASLSIFLSLCRKGIYAHIVSRFLFCFCCLFIAHLWPCLINCKFNSCTFFHKAQKTPVCGIQCS